MIKKIRVQNFRKHTDYLTDFKEVKTIITGANGSGKTSLIEAIYIGLIGKSWRSKLDDITKNNKSWWRVDIETNNISNRTIKYQNNQSNFIVDTTEFKRLPNKFKYPVILFEPNDLNLLYSSPMSRRDYIDKLIGSLNVDFNKNSRRYSRVLKQRNNLLKQNSTQNDLFVWDIQLADLAAVIISTRHEFIQKINQYLPSEYKKINGGSKNLLIEYKYYSDDINKTRQDILNELHSNYRREIITGHTSVGPHQHDFLFHLDDKPAVSILSRGENRGAILALKNTEYILKRDTSPLILLDDVLSEFDEKRQNNLLKNYKNSQVIITSVKTPAAVKDFHKIELK